MTERKGATAELVPQEGSQGTALIRPAAEPSQILDALKAFTEFKAKVLNSVENATCKIGDKTYLKKEAWVTAKLAFRIRTEVVREGWQKLPDGSVSFVCVVRATAPNGDSAEAVGVCDTREDFYRQGKKIPLDEAVPDGITTFRVRDKYGNWNRYIPKPLSAIAGFAQTRAQNRAISTLIGGGENSAEEVMGHEEEAEAPRPATAPAKATPSESRPPKPTAAGVSRTPVKTGIILKFGKHKGKDLGECPTDYLEWMREKPLNEQDERFGETNAKMNKAVLAVLEERSRKAPAPAKKSTLPDERVVEGDKVDDLIQQDREAAGPEPSQFMDHDPMDENCQCVGCIAPF